MTSIAPCPNLPAYNTIGIDVKGINDDVSVVCWRRISVRQVNFVVQKNHDAQDHLSSSVSDLWKTTQQSPVPLSQESVQWPSLPLYAVLVVLYTEISFAPPRGAATFTQSAILSMSSSKMLEGIRVETQSQPSCANRPRLGETQLLL